MRVVVSIWDSFEYDCLRLTLSHLYFECLLLLFIKVLQDVALLEKSSV